jgi:hypothetical protein
MLHALVGLLFFVLRHFYKQLVCRLQLTIYFKYTRTEGGIVTVKDKKRIIQQETAERESSPVANMASYAICSEFDFGDS